MAGQRIPPTVSGRRLTRDNLGNLGADAQRQVREALAKQREGPSFPARAVLGSVELKVEAKPYVTIRQKTKKMPKTEADFHETAPDSPLPHPQPQRDQAPALDGPAAGEVRGVQRSLVRFVGFRVRPLDPDNFAGSVKDLLDGLRHAALISGDEPWRIVLETEQVKVRTYAEEKTVIEIETA